MWYCVKCGKPTPREKLIRGYCPDCFIKYVDLFKQIPEVKLTTCPSCGSWLIRGEWYPALSIPEVLEQVLTRELGKNLIDGAKLINLYIESWEQVDASTIKALVELEISIDDKPLRLEKSIIAKIVHQKCPRCIARKTGKFTHLVQIRFTTKNYSRRVLEQVVSTALNAVSEDSIVDIKELVEGVDLELDEATDAKRVLEALVKKYSAKITSSFRPTRFDASSGKWIGVVTYVARIPVFSEEEVVVYKGRVGIVKSIDQKTLLVLNPETGSIEEVDVDMYWRGELKQPVRVEREEFIVKEVIGDKIVIENPATSEVRVIKQSKLLEGLKPGCKVILIRADNIESIMPVK
jgi:nonsense-mediated mRNA decay protein 3